MTDNHLAPGLALSARGLAASYDGWPIFDGVDLDVAPGEYVVLTDENDVVRSAFLRTLAGEQRARAGTVRSAPLRAVWHADGLPEDVAVADSIRSALPRVDPTELLEGIGLTHRASHEPWAMSAGERRRIALSIAFADDKARVLLLDEPERGLDASGVRWVVNRIADRRHDGTAMIVATYDERLRAAADRSVRLVD